MKIFALLGSVVLLLTIKSASADGHGELCGTQYNWWYNTADNTGPPGYKKETANEKLMRLTTEAGIDAVSPCQMQRNANAYYEFVEDRIRRFRNVPLDETVPGFGLPFNVFNKTLDGYTPLCDSKGGEDLIAGCAFAYPGNNISLTPAVSLGLPANSTFTRILSTCRLKLFGFGEEERELQWCMTNILGSMKVGKEGGYYDQDNPPDISCGISTILGEVGSNIPGPLNDNPYPTKFLDGTEIPAENLDDLTPANDPYQSKTIILRQLTTQLIDGMCNECDECIDLVSKKFTETVKNPYEFCGDNGLCSEHTKKSKRSKKSRNKPRW